MQGHRMGFAEGCCDTGRVGREILQVSRGGGIQTLAVWMVAGSENPGSIWRSN
jgi:hypothetical protein